MKRAFCGLFIVGLFFVFAVNLTSAEQDPNRIKQEIGEKEKPSYQAFLRKTTVILNSGQQSIDCSFGYRRNEINNVVISTTSREFSLDTSYHLGLPHNIEAYLDVPLLWREDTVQNQLEQTKERRKTQKR